MTLNGIVYMPGSEFSYAGTGSIKGANLTVIAGTFNLTGSATITSPATSPYFNGGGGPSGKFLIE